MARNSRRRNVRRRPRRKSFLSGITGQIIAIIALIALIPLGVSAVSGYNVRSDVEALEGDIFYNYNATIGYAYEIYNGTKTAVTPTGTLYTTTHPNSTLVICLDMQEEELNEATFVRLKLGTINASRVSLCAVDTEKGEYGITRSDVESNTTILLTYDAIDYTKVMDELGDVDYCTIVFTKVQPGTHNITVELVKPEGLVIKHTTLINSILYAGGILFILIALASTASWDPLKGLL